MADKTKTSKGFLKERGFNDTILLNARSYATGQGVTGTKLSQLLDQYIKYKTASDEEIVKVFWKESAKLIDAHRKDGNEQQAQGIVDCRILIDRISKQIA